MITEGSTDLQMPAQPGWVYVLRLQDHCWYVGYTAEIETRIATHFLGRGAQWTRLHPPEAVESVQPGDTVLENAVTIALMAKHGWKSVRGGHYLEIDLPAAPKALHKAFAMRPPPPLPMQISGGHGVVVHKIKEDGPMAWRARVAGQRAAKSCPQKGYKTLYAASEAELREEVGKWLEEPMEIEPEP